MGENSWKRTTLGEICLKVTSGGTPSRRMPNYFTDGHIPWVKTKELNDGWICDTEEHITDDAMASSSAKMLPENTVLLAMYGATVGQLGILAKPMTCNQACCAFVVDPEKADFRYVFYQLLLRKPELKSLATGAAQQNLSGQFLKSYMIPIPPLPAQRRIAHILGTLDDKIELNRRINATLEAIAHAIFKSWFIDFDPVRAKAAGRPSGLPPEVDAFFPARFEDSEVGQIPRGWRIGRFSDISKISIGGDWGADEAFPEAIPVRCLRGVDLEHLKNIGSADPPIRWVKKQSLEKRTLSDRDVIIAASGVGPLGRTIWVNGKLLSMFNMPLSYSNFTKRITAENISDAIYLERILFNMREDGEIWEFSTGTALPNLDLIGLMHAKKILIPPDEIRVHFASIVMPIYELLNSSENRILGEIRDSLLPILVTGAKP